MKLTNMIVAFAAIFAAATAQAQIAPKFKRGDVNQDNVVTVADVTALGVAMSRFIRGDANQSGIVDTVDVAAIASALPQFKRGDADQSGVVDVSDPTYIQNYLFNGGPAPPCMDAADANDDGSVNQTDSIYILNWLFNGGPAPPNPGPITCGFDPTSDALSCISTWCMEFVPACWDAADVDDSGVFNYDDYATLVNYLFQGGPAPPAPFPNCGTDPTADSLSCACGDICGTSGLRCMDAADVNDDGDVTCADSDYLNNYLFGGGPAPPAPGPTTCGTDPTADGLGCASPICP